MVRSFCNDRLRQSSAWKQVKAYTSTSSRRKLFNRSVDSVFSPLSRFAMAAFRYTSRARAIYCRGSVSRSDAASTTVWRSS